MITQPLWRRFLAHYIEQTVLRPQTRLTVLRQQVTGDTLDVSLKVRSPLCTRAGVARIPGRDLLRVRGGQITAFRFVPDFSDEPTAVFFGSLGIGPRAAASPPKP